MWLETQRHVHVRHCWPCFICNFSTYICPCFSPILAQHMKQRVYDIQSFIKYFHFTYVYWSIPRPIKTLFFRINTAGGFLSDELLEHKAKTDSKIYNVKQYQQCHPRITGYAPLSSQISHDEVFLYSTGKRDPTLCWKDCGNREEKEWD